MKRKLLLGVVTSTLISTQVLASNYEDILGITVLKVDCGSGPAGFEVIVKYVNSQDATLFNSCVQNENNEPTIPSGDVFEANANVQSITLTTPTRESQNVTRYYTLPNGYTQPPVEANNTCVGGYQDNYAWGRTSCTFREGTSSLDENGGLTKGWLNLVTLSDYHDISGLGLKNIDNLKNLHIINNGHLNIYNTSIKNVNGLINLTGLSNQNSSTFSGSTWGSDRLSPYASHRGLKIINNKKLENVNGLVNFRASDWVDLTGNDMLTNIRGLKNLKLRTNNYAVYVDDRNFDVKLPSDSWLCQNPSQIKVKAPNAYYGGNNNSYVIEYSKVCE